MNKHRAGKALFLSAAVVLAGLSISDVNVVASNDGIEERLFKNIEIAAQKGNLQESKADIQRVLRLNPRHSGATFYAGQYSFAAGNFANAEKFFKRLENNQKYGSRARQYLADMRAAGYRKKLQETLGVLMSGESYQPALNLCEESLKQNPDNQEILFTAAYAATMLNYQSKSENLAERYAKLTNNSLAAAELRAFVDGWYTATDFPEAALEKLLSITDRRLLTSPVRDLIKDLIVSLKLIDKFAAFIEREKKVAGADTGGLERELIGFLIEQQQFEQALLMINRRPVDSIDDNILYIKLLSLTAQEKKAMATARQLLANAPQDLRLYQAWIGAWLMHVERTKMPPDGLDEGGKSFTEMADELLDLLKPDKLIISHPDLLINMLRLACMTSNDAQIKNILPQVLRIALNNKLAFRLIATVDELIIFNKASIAIDLLESGRNQLPDNYDLPIKLAEVHLVNNPEISAKILESVIKEKPEMLRAFLLWTDSLNLTGHIRIAEQAILQRMGEPGISELVKRQLAAKLEVLRMQNIQDSSDENYAEED